MHWVSNVLRWVIGIVTCQSNLLYVVVSLPSYLCGVSVANIISFSVVGNVNYNSTDGAEK